MAYKLRFRQVHLDFHTSEHIPAIGGEFDKKQFQDMLRLGHVNSITCFSKCHHGWSYHPTEVGYMHPNLKFDLLRAQYEACREIGVNVPVYISAGLDGIIGRERPEWREVMANGQYAGWSQSPIAPGFIKMCFHSPYLDYLCAQIREAAELFPDCNGIFLDIIFQGQCCCRWCMEYMERNGLDAGVEADRLKCAHAGLMKYYEKTTEACKINLADMPVFHNSGHIGKGDRDILKFFSHLELESLPTGGWGYDHYPLSAKYAATTGLDVLGMTGKFHTMWGEFGGYKHPNALKYECAAMLAFGSKCSVGDQLHPNGLMDETTYSIIGEAYREVEEKEPWCDGAVGVADIAVLSSESEGFGREADTGAGRVLLEGHFLFDLIDRKVDFNKYRMLILPDAIVVDDELKPLVDSYLAGGGKLLLSGKSGLGKDGGGFALDIGADYDGESEWQPDYVGFGCELAPDFVKNPLVMYMKSQKVKATAGRPLADVYKPYFNRTWQHFCSHQHAPADSKTGCDAAVLNGNTLYLAHPIFSIYHALGAVAYKDYAVNAIRLLLGDDETIAASMSSTGRISLMDQPAENRYVLHLLYANKIARGAAATLSAEGYASPSKVVEVIEDLEPARDTEVALRLPRAVKSVRLAPQGDALEFSQENGVLRLKVDEFVCHQMIELAY